MISIDETQILTVQLQGEKDIKTFKRLLDKLVTKPAVVGLNKKDLTVAERDLLTELLETLKG